MVKKLHVYGKTQSSSYFLQKAHLLRTLFMASLLLLLKKEKNICIIYNKWKKIGDQVYFPGPNLFAITNWEETIYHNWIRKTILSDADLNVSLD